MSQIKKTAGAIGTAAGIAAMAAAAAGAYFFYYGKDGGKNRKHLKSWAVKAKGEIMEHMEKMKNVSQETYDKTVNEVMAKYKNIKTIDPKELADLGMELKSHWDKIAKQLTGAPAKTAPAKTGKPKAKAKKK